jgi:hypothetical protein
MHAVVRRRTHDIISISCATCAVGVEGPTKQRIKSERTPRIQGMQVNIQLAVCEAGASGRG